MAPHGRNSAQAGLDQIQVLPTQLFTRWTIFNQPEVVLLTRKQDEFYN